MRTYVCIHSLVVALDLETKPNLPLTENKELHIHELQRKIDSLEESCQDYENTITQFRDLVVQLQKYVSRP